MTKSAKRQPNVIVFFTDQQRWDSTGLAGNPLGLTPNFDRIAKANTFLPNSFTCQPVCGPARACLQTGQFATNTGVWRNGRVLDPNARTLAKCFNDAGYRTGYIGKWHLASPSNQPGYSAVTQELRGGYQDWLASNSLEHTSDSYQTRVWDENNNPVDLPGYRADAMTDAAIRYVDDRTKEDKPFFLFISYIEPHHQNHIDAYPAPDGYREMYESRWVPPDLAALPAHGFGDGDPNRHLIGGTTQQHLSGYWGMIKRLDECFGRINDALKSLHIDDNTIILFTSDHGCHFKTRNSEYKRSCHESSIHVPTLFAGPGFKHGGALPQLISLVDLPPTLLDAAGLDIPNTMEGRSILPLVKRDTADWPDDLFVQVSESCDARVVRTNRWKYCVTAQSEGENKSVGRSDSYTETHLYDLHNDPYELTNLIHSNVHEPVASAMRNRLLKWIKKVEKEEPTIVLPDRNQRAQRKVTPEEALQ